jgi:hypothetical protein
MKSYPSLVLLMTTLLIFFSCKKNSESIKRDIIISSKSNQLIIPITVDTVNSITFGKVTMTSDLDQLIKAQDGAFGVENITSIKISGFKFSVLDTNVKNNLANFSSLTGQLLISARDTILLASSTQIQNVPSNSLVVPIVNQNTELKPYLVGNSLNYVVAGVLRRPLTKSLTSIIVPQYTITVEK